MNEQYQNQLLMLVLVHIACEIGHLGSLTAFIAMHVQSFESVYQNTHYNMSSIFKSKITVTIYINMLCYPKISLGCQKHKLC